MEHKNNIMQAQMLSQNKCKLHKCTPLEVAAINKSDEKK
jgi:hypothetical protein